jgi:SAM-dependent methyltransferase
MNKKNNNLNTTNEIVLNEDKDNSIKKINDKQYWNTYYKENKAVSFPSPFAQYCIQKIPKNSFLLELGCGNGRDSLFFAQQGVKVVACDLAEEAITRLKETNAGYFFTGDFSNLTDDQFEQPLDVIYSRWTIHSLNQKSASKALRWVHRNLADNGSLLIEARSVNDKLFGKGKPAERDAFITDHYRRFIRKHELIEELKQIGFEIEEDIESKGLAIHKDEDPVVIRIIARKIPKNDTSF